MTADQSPSEASAALGAAEPMYVRNMRRFAQGEQLHDPALSARMLLADYDRRGEELDRLHRVQCLGHVYSPPYLQGPERCGYHAGHEGECQP